MDSEGLSFRACQPFSATATAAQCAPATSVPSTNKRWGVSGWIITASANVVAAVAATLSDGTTTITIQIPAGQIPSSVGFVNLPRILPFAIGAAVTLTIPSLGAAVVCSATLFVVPLSA